MVQGASCIALGIRHGPYWFVEVAQDQTCRQSSKYNSICRREYRSLLSNHIGSTWAPVRIADLDLLDQHVASSHEDSESHLQYST